MNKQGINQLVARIAGNNNRLVETLCLKIDATMGGKNLNIVQGGAAAA